MDNPQRPETGAPTVLLGGERRKDAGRHQAAPLSVVILSFNEEANLPACLDSLKGLHCGVFVVDSFSTDKTQEIAQSRGVSFHQHIFENYASQRNWAQRKLPIET